MLRHLFIFSLVFLLSHVRTVTSVTGCLSDRDRDDRPRENCTAAGFSDVPTGFQPTTKVLLFPGNVFSALPWSSFQYFTEIYEIDFTSNQIPVVTPSSSPILPSLGVLRLGRNRLTSLPGSSFSACPALIELYLQHNAINSLRDDSFSGLSKLEILDLSSNHIKVLPELMMHPLPAIETLFLENNKIQLMPDQWFSSKEEVPYLYLSANPWACFCTLHYFTKYLDDYDYNVYVRDGKNILNEVETVVCATPESLKARPVVRLDKSELCPPFPEPGSRGDFLWPKKTTETPHQTSTAAHTTMPTHPPPPVIPTTSATTTISTTYPATTTCLTSLDTTSTPTQAPPSTLSPTTASTPTTLPQTMPRLSTLPAVRPSNKTVYIHIKTPGTTTTPVPSTVEATTKTTTQKHLQVVTTTTAFPSSTKMVINAVGVGGRRMNAAVKGVFCLWLFAGCLLLCVAAAACILATLWWLVIWYKQVYKPLSVSLAKRRRGGGEALRLLPYKDRQEIVAGVIAQYRSVLFVQRESLEAEMHGGNIPEINPKAFSGSDADVVVEPARAREGTAGGVYRKTLYRVLSRETEVEGWRDVVEECQAASEENVIQRPDVGMMDGDGDGNGDGENSGGGGVSRKVYSVILREEKEGAGLGAEQIEWVVGGWEVKRGGSGQGREVDRSSWGEWLAHYLPTMPWGVTMPPEGQ